MIKKAFSFPYYIIFLFVFLFFISLNIFVNDLYITVPAILSNTSFLGIAFIASTIIVGLLVALNINLVIMKIKQLKTLRKFSKRAGGATAGGIFAGVLGAACPGCFAGLFPAFLGLFGITATSMILPLNGLEIQLFSVVLLIISIFMLSKGTCKVNINKIKRNESE